MARVLIIDDEKNIRTTLSVCLEHGGHAVTVAENPGRALAALEGGPQDIALLDLNLGSGGNGLDLLPRLLEASPHLAVIVITAYATIGTAVKAMQLGAVDYLPKPFTPDQILHVVGRIAQRLDLTNRVRDLESFLQEAIPEVFLDTRAPAMKKALSLLESVAPTDAAVLLRGENGTGKGVFARLLHARSRRAAAPFCTVSCPTLSADLLASDLFGHAKGAFTGAVRDQLGKVEAADGGTLFLDEITEMAPDLQVKLLRFLQEKQFERVGESRTRRADVRVVTASNRDIEAEVRAGRLREDLLYRVNVLEITLPALRDRPEDIVPLATGFLAFFARQQGRPVPSLAPAAADLLVGYAWPGNVRELRNVIERALIVWPAATLGPEAFPERLRAREGLPPALAVGGAATLEELERAHIEQVLARSGSLEEAASRLGIDASTLWRKRKKFGL